MKQFSYFLLFLCIISNLSAQTSKKINEDTFEKYLLLGHKYIDFRKLDSASYFLRKLDSIKEYLPKDSSRFYKKEVLEATLLVRKSRSEIPVQKLIKALSYFKEKKDSANIGLCLLKLGVANYYLNRRNITKEYSEQALQYKESLSKRVVTKIYQNIGTVNLEDGMQKNDSLVFLAIKSYKKAIVIYQEENWTSDQALATSLLAECYNQLGFYDTALHEIGKAIKLSKKADNKSNEGFALIKKTSFLGNKKEYSTALKTIRIAKSIFLEQNDNSTYLYALIEEKKILIGLKKYKEASIIGDEIFQVSVGNYNINFANKVAEMDAKYLSAEREKEIFQQKKELLAKELVIKNKDLSSTLLASALLILAILSFGYYHRYQFKKKQLQKEIDLKDALSKIRTQNRLQEQRLRISRDLHDNIGSQLTFIISSIDNLKYISKDANTKLKDKLSSISSFTTETIFQLRDTIWAMNKSEISIEDLQARILSFIEKAKSATKNIEFSVYQEIEENISMTSIKGMNVFRVIQEAINNSIKYADASKIIISITKKENNLVISIKDNGKGFDINNIDIGNGFSNIEKRINEIDGIVNINSKEKKGTEITLTVSLKNTANDV